MNRTLPILLSSLILTCTWKPITGQSGKPSAQDFIPAGDAVKIGDNCFRLTEAIDWAGGSLWHKTAIDLSAPFEMEIDLMMGCKDAEGADGIVFVFHPQSRATGFRGEGMGFGGLVPSLGIEIDTWQNFHLLDPAADHIALMYNGNLQHDYSLAGPVEIPNVEDCRYHRLKVTWNPSGYRMKISLDGKEVISYSGNIVKNIFRGNPKVYWGVTAATGRYNNRQEICFEKLTYLPAAESLAFDKSTSNRLLKGETITLEKLNFESGKADLLPDSHSDLEKLYRFLKDNPGASIGISGHTDNVGDDKTNRALSKRRADAVAEYLVRKGVSRDRIRSKGFGKDFPRSSNATPEGRRKNRRVEVYVFRHIP